jgi:hypothetical protein
MVSNYTQAQKQKTDLSEVNLLGQVKTLSYIEYRLNRDNIFVQKHLPLPVLIQKVILLK